MSAAPRCLASSEARRALAAAFSQRRGWKLRAGSALPGRGGLCERSGSFLPVIGSRGHVRAGGWNSELRLRALLFLFKSRWVWGASSAGLGALLLETGARRTQPGWTEAAEGDLPRCSVRAPGPQLQAATTSIP